MRTRNKSLPVFPLQHEVHINLTTKGTYLLAIVALCVGPLITFGQGAKKCFEYAQLYEADKDYTTALYWYHEGSLKGALKNYSFGTEACHRIIPIVIYQKYDSANDAGDYPLKLKFYRRAGMFIKEERSRWSGEDDKRKIVPDWVKFDKILTELSESKLKEGERIGTRESMVGAYNAVVALIGEQRGVFDYKDEKGRIGIPAELTDTYLKKINQLACGEEDKMAAMAQASYDAGSFRDAYVKASEAKKYMDDFGCTDGRPDKIMRQALVNGGVSIAVFPIKGQENLRNIDSDIVSAIQGLENPFVAGIDPKTLENQLLQKDISIEDTYSADIVALSKLGNQFGFNCIVTGKVLLADGGNANISTKQLTAYKVNSDSEGKFAHERVTFSEGIGKQTSRYKAQIKIVDLKSKAILYSDIVEYSYTDEIHYASSPVSFSNLSPREFDNFKETTGSAGLNILNALVAGSVPGDVRDWRPQWVALEGKRRNFIGQEEIIKSFAGKVRTKVAEVIDQNYGVR